MAQSPPRRGRNGSLILAPNGPFHELSSCVLRGSQVVAFAEEERFTRKKKAKYPEPGNADQLPAHALRYCLETAGVTGADLDLVGYPYDPDVPVLVPDDPVVAGGWGSEDGEAVFQDRLRRVPALLSDLLDDDITDRFRWVPHHLAHGASAFFASPYDNAAVLSIDGRGEATTTLLAHGRGVRLEPLEEIRYPHSIGFLWEAISQFHGLDQFAGPGQLMGLAAWGNPDRYAKELGKILTVEPDGFRIDNSYTQFRLLERGAPAGRLEDLFGPRYAPAARLDARAADIAAALQDATSQVLLNLAARLRTLTGSSALCLAGGVALNAVAMGRIARESGYDDVFVQPAAGDAGCALGAALWLAHGEAEVTDRWVMTHPFLGPSFSDADMVEALDAVGLPYTRPDDIVGHTARLLADGKLVAWFQGPAAVGPRALGDRSLLADPRDPLTLTKLNLIGGKQRQDWRPVAPSILAEDAADWLDLSGARSPSYATMNLTSPVHPHRQHEVPAVVHADGHARAQLVSRDTNPRYHELIRHFHRITGVPMLVNTSLNGPHEPIVHDPAGAVATWLPSGIDVLVLGDLLVQRKGIA